MLLWVEDFPSDRQMRVSVNGAYSDLANVTSAVPQGSVGTTFVLAIRE